MNYNLDDNYKRYIKDIRGFNALTIEEEMDLRDKIVKGCQKSRDELYRRHLKYVIHEAKSFYSENEHIVSFTDIINEGNYGLMVAINKFEYDRDNRFLTYASYYIRHYIINSLGNVNTIKVPNRTKETREKTFPKSFSMDTTVITNHSDNSEYSWDFIDEDPNYHEIDYSCLTTFVDALDVKGREVMYHYYGLNGYPTLCLEEIGKLLSLSKERVRQIKEKSIRILRSNANLIIESIEADNGNNDYL